MLGESVQVDGTEYRINDHVYVLNEQANEPHYVGRITEFVQPTQNHSEDQEIQVKIAWFYRSQDVEMRRRKNDVRLLVASMNVESNPVSSLRGKCSIRHTREVSQQMKAYTARPSCFYYDQLHDRYTMKLYDVVPLDLVHLTDKIARYFENYDYILVEAGKSSDYISKRVCKICNKWSDPSSATTCYHCAEGFHLACIDLERKPNRGFVYQCSSCVKEIENITSDDDQDSGNNRKAEASGASTHPPVMEDIISQVVPEEKSIWPFRYFGDFSSMEDLIQSTGDRLMPKASSRIGKEYQANIPDFTDAVMEQMRLSGTLEEKDPNSMPLTRRKRKGSIVDFVPRRESNELYFDMPKDLISDDEMSDFFSRCIATFPPKECVTRSIDIQNRALAELHLANYGIETAFAVMSDLSWSDLGIQTWTPEEVLAFEAGVTKYGHDMEFIRREMKTDKTVKDIVCFFYSWKRTPRYAPVYLQYCRTYKPQKKLKKIESFTQENVLNTMRLPRAIEDMAEDVFLLEGPCFHCGFETSPHGIWSKLPLSLDPNRNSRKAMCLLCSNYWLHYAGLRPLDGTHMLRGRRRKRGKADSPTFSMDLGSLKKMSFSKIGLKQAGVDSSGCCAVCLSQFSVEENQLLSCVDCGLRVHQHCYGIYPETVTNGNLELFTCSRCENKKNPEVAINYNCILCPHQSTEQKTALRRTIGSNWLHQQCAIWIPEATFSLDDTVESLGYVNPERFKLACNVCKLTERGACIQCCDLGCKRIAHVSCAQLAGWQLVIEHVDQSLELECTQKQFDMPLLSANAYCIQHRRLTPGQGDGDMAKTESFEIEQSTLIAELIQQKRMRDDMSTRCERRAQSWRLDSLERVETVPMFQTRCCRCRVSTSPIWWPEANGRARDVVCQACHSRQMSEIER